jgi:hypothetical protein
VLAKKRGKYQHMGSSASFEKGRLHNFMHTILVNEVIHAEMNDQIFNYYVKWHGLNSYCCMSRETLQALTTML